MKQYNPFDGKPSRRMHEVADTSRHFEMIIHCGSKSSCVAYWRSQPADKRQHLTVRLAGR